MNILHRRLLLLVVLTCMCLAREASAGPQVDVVVGEKAPQLERYAATELAAQFKRLFDADVRITEKAPEESKFLILLGSPETNAAVKSLGDAWPKLSDQGHALKSLKFGNGRALLVGGGSPVATLWGVYELGQRFGMRYTLYEDLAPLNAPDLKLDGFDVVLEPALAVRTWQALETSPIGPESWGLVEQQRVLRQLAKLKFNHVLLKVYPWQPFVDFEFKGVHKETGVLWHGRTFRVDGDTAGRSAFRGAKLFENPDFAGKSTYQERVKAGVGLIRGTIDTAHSLGMKAALAFSPLEFPKEFQKVLPKTDASPGSKGLAIDQRRKFTQEDVLLADMAKTQIRAYVSTYPELDQIVFPFWDAMTMGVVLSVNAQDLLRTPDGRVIEFGYLDQNGFFGSMSKDKAPPKPTNPVIKFWNPDNGNVTLTAEGPGAASVSLMLPLTGSSASVLPRTYHEALPPILKELAHQKWIGFGASCWGTGETDLSINCLAQCVSERASDSKRTFSEILHPFCGEGVTETMLKTFSMIEEATLLIDKSGDHFGDVAPDMIMRHYAANQPFPEAGVKARDLYMNAMNETYRANTRAREKENGKYTMYFTRRLDFAFQYMSCLDAVCKAGIAKAKGDKETQLTELESAVASINGALNTLAVVARSNSDRGIIAVLNEFGYRPLQKELEAVEQAASK